MIGFQITRRGIQLLAGKMVRWLAVGWALCPDSEGQGAAEIFIGA
jgi:hypothetical protein